MQTGNANNMLKELLLKYNRPGPRYTSYPPANFFTEKTSVENFKSVLIKSNKEKPENISLYFHVPFCPQLCHFCGCNTDEMLKMSVVELYFKAMLTEIDNISALLSKDRKVTQIHWGGGTPNSVAFKFIEEVMLKLKNIFTLAPNAEIAMECSPAYISKDYINKLRSVGFNRISLGVQDFNEKVLEVVNRAAPRYPIEEIIADIREAGFEGVNIDLIYGLPLQTEESYLKTIERALKLRPDRLVTFSYAHVPWVKSAQKKLEKYGLPSPEEKLEMLLSGYSKITEAGYEAIGMDHFALMSDELAIAKNEKLLHRNFQGYCTKETTGQVYSFGSTGINQLHDAYFQSAKSTSEYIRLINETGFANIKGYELSIEEKAIRRMINEIMCNGILDFKDLALEFNLSVEALKKICKFEESKFAEFIADNLMHYENNKLNVTENGMMVVRNIAMTFDPNLAENVNMYSKTI
ncbi:MAG: oxygen-independent coproporphyrinogen III oxidase [Salinivirgaceae bacterium]|jgi:oxygen-independent coproporphyrinogen-3 oxidase|nr:oxygen-independent coproporphyrinogen III oxidase [Salinivirgaceae bacterium]